MKKILISLFLGISTVWAQKSTEMYIPIGQSPGLSGKSTIMGKIMKINSSERSLQIGEKWVKISNQTHIWLDRSQLKAPNLVGTYADCSQGLLAEAKLVNKDITVAEWLKLQVTQK